MQEERKQAELKQVRKGPTRKIPDRVGYDWNKFGRLIELRERHLARKFLKIWTLKTFGRILPNAAKTHYQSVVLRRAFEGWKDEWWASRKEWCLTTIANCHNRYSLCNLAFQHWQMFMNMQKEKKSKVQQAVQFAHRNLMRLAWNRWEVLRELRMKKRMLESSLELKKIKTHQSAWNIWQARLQQHHNLHTMEKPILKQRGQSSPQRIESQHWKQWQDCLNEAEDKHFQPLREVSLTMHSTFLQRSHFNHWRERLTERRHMQELQHQVDACFAEQMLPSCFESWVELTRQRRLQKQRKHKADISNQHRLYTWVFSTWWSQTEKHKDHMLSERLAVLHEEQSHLQRVWRCWKEKINEKEKQTVTTWTDISTEQQDGRCQEQDSFTQNDQHVRKCAEDKGKQVLIALREVTPSAVSAYHQQREALTRVQMSLNQVRLLQCFRQWRKEAAHARSEKIYMKRARWHHESKLLTKAMKAWNEHHDLNHINKVRKRQGILLLRLKMYQKFFDMWKLKLQHRRREAELKERALWHWSLTLQAKVLCRWRWWVAEQHLKQEQAAGAALVHRDEPLMEDLKSCLTYAAHMKDPTAGPAEDSQEQEPFCLPGRSECIHNVVRSCALHWKQRALSKPRTEQQIRQEPKKKKSVTFSCTTPELTTIPSPDSVELEYVVEELRKLLASRMCRRQPCRSPLANLHKEMAITDTAAAPEPILSSFNSRKAHLGESSTSSLLQSSVYPDVCVGESGGQANRVDPASSLTKELLSIQQDMNTYQKNRKQLWAWKKLREVLQSWIQTSGQDDQSEKNTVCQEIKELEERIDRLSTELAKQKPKMLLHSERIQHLQATLTCGSVLMASH